MNPCYAVLVALMGIGCASSPAPAPSTPTDSGTDGVIGADLSTAEAPTGLDLSMRDALSGDPSSGDAPDVATTDARTQDLSSVTAALIAARPYGSHVPTGYSPQSPTPLVVLLHGYGATGALQDFYFRLGRLSDDRVFLLATPDGTLDPSGQRFWNATDACCDFARRGVDDVAYVTAVIDDMSARYNVDPRRVFLVGHSNGGFMAHRYACDRSGRVAAVVSLAGATWNDPLRCSPDHPVSVLGVHGTADITIAYDGGLIALGAAFPSAHTSVARWAGHNRCDAAPTTLATRLDLDTVLVGSETHIERHERCSGGAAELWTIEGGGHIPALGASWAPSIYDWLMAHAR